MVGIVQDPTIPLEDVAALDMPALAPRSQRVKRLERPSKADLDEQIAKVQEEIDDLQARVAEIRIIVDNKQQNKHVASQELLDARNRLADLNATFRSVLDEKRSLREELDLADKARERMRSDAKALRETLPYVRVEQIDEQIRKLEYRMAHTSLSLQEEKKLVSQVEGLKKSRDVVRDYSESMDHITQDERSRADFLDKIKEKDRLLNSLKAQQDEQRRILGEIREKEASQALDIPALLQEKSASLEKIKVLRDKVKELRADFRSREDEFWEREREWKAQQALERKFRSEKREAERKEWERVRKQRALENFVEPYTDELILCDQLISYMQKLAPSVDDLEAVVSQKVEIVAPKGFGNVIISKKNRTDDDLEGWFGGFGGKGKVKKSKIPTSTKNREKERLSLSLDALTSFEKLKLTPPTAVGDVLRSMDDLKLKKENFLQLQKKAREALENEEEDCDTEVMKEPIADAVLEAAVHDQAQSESVEDGSQIEVLQSGGADSLSVKDETEPEVNEVVSCENEASVGATEDVVVNRENEVSLGATEDCLDD